MIQNCGTGHAGPSANPKLRLFTGIAVPEEINARLDELVEQLKPLARIRWSPAANFHITTKFIGAWPQDRLEEMKSVLRKDVAMKGGEPMHIAIRGLGFYPNARSPRVFWAGVMGGASLERLALLTDRACAELGIEPEKRAYSAHLTLARIDAPGGMGTLHDALAKLPSKEFGEFDVSAFHLYLSKPGRGGSVYTSLAEFPL